ncbi:MAG TPA: hypothetical protein VMM60_06250 [Ilumatobacter sp.]|nr:hypothetical protein [Ilumatobacter sp.]
MACLSAVLAGTITGDLASAEPSPPEPAPFSQGSVCLSSTSTDMLDTLFEAAPGNVIGADYQRAIPLPDGRVFWMFQDAIVRLPTGAHRLVHNIAMMQDGNCFDVRYGGTPQDPDSFIFGNATVDHGRWFWPLAATLGADGLLYIFAAEMIEHGSTYLEHTEPIATRVAVFDPATGDVLGAVAPADSSASLYGWSITSDDTWTYLYAQCHRQFGWQPFIGYDRDCSAIITVARVPKGHPLSPLQYWNGAGWGADPAAAAPVVTTNGRRINADQFVAAGNRFWSVNKEGDWWGDTVYLSWSRSPTGPFTVYRQLATQPKCEVCTTYFATWIPPTAVDGPPGELAFALSNNQWDGGSPYIHYRPSFRRVAVPPYRLEGDRVLKVPVGREVAAAVLNITTVGPAAPGFVAAYPCDQPRPTVSNLNYGTSGSGTVAANSAVARPDANGDVCVYSLATTDLVVDLAGTFPTVDVPTGQPALDADGFVALPAPKRLLDTRDGGGAAVPAGEVVMAHVAPGTAAAIVNITAVGATTPGFLSAYACGEERPETSTVNYGAPGSGSVTANAAVVRPDSSGAICVYSTAAVHVLVDLAGTFADDSGFTTLDRPTRLLDTRSGHGTGTRSEFRRVLAGETLALQVFDGGPTSDPPDEQLDDEHWVAAVALNVTAVGPAGPGFITVHACDVGRPGTSNVNFQTAGGVAANLVVARPDAEGYVCLYSLTDVDLVVDIAGSVPSTAATYEPLDTPVRLLDTRIAGLSRS